jgi:hypothetical protein
MPFAMLRWFTPRHFEVKMWIPIDGILIAINVGLGLLLYIRSRRVRSVAPTQHTTHDTTHDTTLAASWRACASFPTPHDRSGRSWPGSSRRRTRCATTGPVCTCASSPAAWRTSAHHTQSWLLLVSPHLTHNSPHTGALRIGLGPRSSSNTPRVPLPVRI